MAGRSVVLASIEPVFTGGAYTPFSFGIRRIQAELLCAGLADLDVTLLESADVDPEAWAERIAAGKPDIVGLSAYVWSFPTFCKAAERLRRMLPNATVVMGGPSARAEMFSLAPFLEARRSVDALVLRDGEASFVDIVARGDRSPGGLRDVAGLALPSLLGFSNTAASAPRLLDELASPVAMNLVPRGRTVALETFRGCPLSCTFCQWGTMDSPENVFSEAYIARELRALDVMDAPSAQLVDAGVNLNSRAFKNLAAAESQVRFFRHRSMFACIYPTRITDAQLEFLHSIARPHLDVGIQSFEESTLETVERPFKERTFDAAVGALADCATLEFELILGLPGDTPEGFWRSFERARRLPGRLRVFHCLVLPDALLTRAPEGADLRFDPVTLELASGGGWSADALREAMARLDAAVVEAGVEPKSGMWEFPDPRGEEGGASRGSSVRGRPLDSASVMELERAVVEGSDRAWELYSASARGLGLELVLGTPEGAVVIELRPADGRRAYRTFGGVSFSYKSDREGGGALTSGALERLERVARALHLVARRVMSTYKAQ